MSKIPAYLQMLKSPEPATRQLAVSQLQASDDIAAFAPLLLVLQDDIWYVRAAAVVALGWLYARSNSSHEPAADTLVAAILPFLHEPEAGMRIAVVRALGWIADPRAFEPVLEALADADIGVQEEARKTLGKLGDHRAVQPLLGLLKQPDEWARYDAAIALGKLGAAEAVEPLIELLTDASQVVRAGAVIALTALGAVFELARPPLAAMLHDPDPDVRFRAIEAMVKLRQIQAVPALRQLAAQDQAWGNGQRLSVAAVSAVKQLEGSESSKIWPGFAKVLFSSLKSKIKDSKAGEITND